MRHSTKSAGTSASSHHGVRSGMRSGSCRPSSNRTPGKMRLAGAGGIALAIGMSPTAAFAVGAIIPLVPFLLTSGVAAIAVSVKGSASSSAEPAVANVGRAFANVADMTDPNAKERYELRNMLKELSETARSIRVWSSYLERHPEALITGKSGTKRK